MQSHTFTLNGHQLHYVTAGSPDKPALIMIHGYTLSHHVWRTTIPALENDMYCVAIDLLGHGASDIAPQGDYSIEAQGRRVLALADKLGLQRFSLIGHSMGGQIALCIASMLAPQRVEKLVHVDGVVGRVTPDIERKVFEPVRKSYGTPLMAVMEVYSRTVSPRFKWAAKIQFASWFYNFDALDFDWWRIDRELVNRVGMRHVWFHGMNAIKGLDLTAHLPDVKAPTLSIFGTEDNVVPVSEGHLVKEHVPDSQLVLIERCGHFPMYEAQQRYLEAVCGFLVG